MAFTPGKNRGALNGTTPVTVVAAPAASTQRMVRSMTVCNIDTAPVSLIVKMVDGGSSVMFRPTLAVGDTWEFGINGECVILDATSASITIVMSGAPATTNPDFTSGWADKS